MHYAFQTWKGFLEPQVYHMHNADYLTEASICTL